MNSDLSVWYKGTEPMFYQLYELNHAMMAPFRASADAMNLAWKNPLNPWSHTAVGRSFSAGFEVFKAAFNPWERISKSSI